MGNFERAPDEQVLGIGYPGTEGHKLHAETLVTREYRDIEYRNRVDPYNGDRLEKIACKIVNIGRLYTGMSGGGVFDPITGEFLGIMTSTGTMATGMYFSMFTPVDAIYNLYVRLVPAAAKLGLQPLPLERGECDPEASRGVVVVSTHSPMDNRL
jgi:hypothetical protein